VLPPALFFIIINKIIYIINMMNYPLFKIAQKIAYSSLNTGWRNEY